MGLEDCAVVSSVDGALLRFPEEAVGVVSMVSQKAEPEGGWVQAAGRDGECPCVSGKPQGVARGRRCRGAAGTMRLW